MKILALDSSGLVASVALAEDGRLLGEYTINHKKTHSQTLLPMLDEMGKMAELDLNTVDAVAVAVGPGSFTGLRIGVATAKGIGLALGKPMVAVPTVDALAYNLWGSGGIVCPLMDARRGQVYTGLYRFEQGEMQVISQAEALALEELLQRCGEQGELVTFLGDGVPVYREKIEEQLRAPHLYAPAHMNRQRAGAVAALGMAMLRRGETVSADELAPIYLRLSQAERERAEREKRLAAEKQDMDGEKQG